MAVETDRAWRVWARGLIGLVAIVCLTGGPALAIDPLPPELENAPPEVQTQYIEKMARASYEQKVKVARRRYEQRMRLKQAIHQRMAEEAAARQAQLTNHQASVGRVANKLAPSSKSTFGIVVSVLGALVGLVLLARGWRPREA